MIGHSLSRQQMFSHFLALYHHFQEADDDAPRLSFLKDKPGRVQAYIALSSGPRLPHLHPAPQYCPFPKLRGPRLGWVGMELFPAC